jgi:hypothetical protein
MDKFIIVVIVYLLIMYGNYQKIRNDKLELERYKDAMGRFTFLQFSFGIYDAIQGKFTIISFLYRIIFSHIGITSYSLLKDYIN